jgi:hypothetical protein
MDELNSSEFMNSRIPLENFPLVPQGHHHHHQDHLALVSIAWQQVVENLSNYYFQFILTLL